jgi:hypothetical protein
MIQNLDALFDMTFTALSAHARDLLSVLALLSPGDIPTPLEIYVQANQ